MSSNSQNSQSMPPQVSALNTLGEAWDWGIDGLDQQNFGESYGNPLYSDAQDAESYYGQRTPNITMASANASATQPYAYYQPTQFDYARNALYANHHLGTSQPYTSMGYCRPSAIHNHDSSSDTDYSQFTPPDSSLYGTGLSLNVGLATSVNPYIPTSTPQAFHYGVDKTSWYNPEPRINTDVTISPAMAGATMVPQLSQQTWNQSFGSECSPSSGLSPTEGSARYHSYQSSELSFSDSDSEQVSDVDERPVVLKSNDREHQKMSIEGIRAHQMYFPPRIAPNPGNSNGVGVPRTSSRDTTCPTTVPSSETAAANLLRRPTSSTRDEQRDMLLLQLKREGYSYKDIKRKGNFKEAESTLRGRFRTLTKSKEERVRRPCWTEKDLRLLREGVLRYGGREGSDERSVTIVGGGPAHASYGKVKWMQVAGYIKERGGSYHFGNATCRKKWDEMVKAEREKGGEFLL